MVHKVGVIVNPNSCAFDQGEITPAERNDKKANSIEELGLQAKLLGADFSTVPGFSITDQRDITEKTSEAIQEQLTIAEANGNTLSLVLVTPFNGALETIHALKKNLHQDRNEIIKTASILVQRGFAEDIEPFNKIELKDPIAKTRKELEELAIPELRSNSPDWKLYNETVNDLEQNDIATIATLKKTGTNFDGTQWSTVNKTLEWLGKAITLSQKAA